ncbi:Sec-independent protein translocase protein TatB [Crenalkalicoccus roseus]|uniref:Sec-independent protein translocase protein TatB n=1 Tax=Crenalkalicoccus roseus TaxID=1485588 RepID=UPI001080E727|nr:Sec-independent protein translocase protein TatB [Crenalkalicoccus roseus]
MLDLAWSEIALIAVVALVVIGPKDLPEAIRGVARGVQKLRRMAAEFQSHADELVREAKLEEVRNQIHEVRSTFNEIRNFDLRGEVERTMDSDGTLRRTFSEDPLSPTYGPPAPPAAAPAEAAAPPAKVPAAPEEPAAGAPPAFIPPGAAVPAAAEPVTHPKA